MRNWEFFAKNFNIISDKLIANRDLSRLDIYILASNDLEKKKPYFIKITEDNNKKLD